MTKKLTTILLLLLLPLLSMAQESKIKYVFYFIGDGMGMGHVMSTECYNRTVTGNDTPILMLQFPVASLITTYSYSSPVTDSAAAGTALATGEKTINGMLGMNPDSLALTSIAMQLKERGWGIGIVTSVAADDATPGAFYATQPNRGVFYEIGRQAAASGFEFIAGAGLRGTTDSSGKPNDLYEIFEENDVKVVRGLDGLTTTDSRKVMLLADNPLDPNDIGYTIDSIPGSLTLPSMTEACLKHLENNSPERFFMMVEGGNIDHAGHGNDGATVIKEILNFQEAIEVAYNFYQLHPEETLIVITADHDTGGMALGNTTVGYDARLKYIDYQKVSKGTFSDFCKGLMKSRTNFTWDDMRDYLSANFGLWSHLPVSEAQEEMLKKSFYDTFELRNTEDQQTLYKSYNDFVVKVFDVLDKTTGIGWTSVHHTGGFVPVYAIGPGSELFSTMSDNTMIPRKIMSAIDRD
ncbi:MAG: alkaline phosphatase [Lachnoclostridium sp.]|nr:alkaline phosphatase [Lachnoclostridium sp.]